MTLISAQACIDKDTTPLDRLPADAQQTTLSGYAVAFSAGIRALSHIDKFLEVQGVVSPYQAQHRNLPARCVVVWGRKQKVGRATQYAKNHKLPIWYIEDGWIRSCAQDAHSRRSYSLLVDRQGVYYDSTQPSELEIFLNQTDDEFDRQCGRAQLQYAQICRRRMVEHGITKYNYCRAADNIVLNKGGTRPLVLVVDQTCDDASVRLGGMTEHDFLAMLDAAIDENPGARIVVRTHPDVVVGRRKGYLSDYATQRGIEISAEGDNPIHWLQKAGRVYAGTSQLGYEALLCDCQVTVAGKPFYAGWGLTDDRQTFERRRQSRTIDQLFHATHVHLARYCDPVTGERSQLHDCLEHVIEQKKQFARNAQRFVCVGISGWKRRYLAQYLRSPDGDVRFSRQNDAVLDEQPLCWSFKQPTAKAQTMTRVEDGFLRSQGLGSDFVAPGSLVVDRTGLYFDPTAPSDLENMLNQYDCSLDETLRAARLRNRIIDARLTKYNVSDPTANPCVKWPEAEDRPIVLVVGQVEDDQSIKRGCSDVASNAALCRTVRLARPDAFIVYKPHPDVESGNRRGRVDSYTLRHSVDRVEHCRHFVDCLEESSELHTMTSLSGFEALMRNKPVFTYGLPFYAGWGLTSDHLHCDRRNRVRTLDEMVFLSMIAYPRYLDVVSGEFVTPEQLIEQLQIHAANVSNSKNGTRWLSKLRNVTAAIRYNPA